MHTAEDDWFWSWCFPGAQKAQSAVVALYSVPGAQDTDEGEQAVVVELNSVPARHVLQPYTSASANSWYRPAAQASQAAEAFGAARPAAHVLQPYALFVAASAYKPAGHGVQGALLLAANIPVPHAWQMLPTRVVPVVHGVHGIVQSRAIVQTVVAIRAVPIQLSLLTPVS